LQPLFTTEDEWAIVDHVIEVLSPFGFWTLWMAKWHTGTLHHVITVYNDMFYNMDGVIQGLGKKKTQWKKDLYFAVKCTQRKLSTYYSEEIPTTCLIFASAHIIDPFWKVPSFRKWPNGLDINPDDDPWYTTQYREAYRMYLENKYHPIQRRLSVNKPERVMRKNPFPTTAA
jgi:hypothetical protein